MIRPVAVLFLFICGVYNTAFAQLTVSGVVLYSVTQTGLPFVNIGIRNKNLGTATLSDGTFSILIPLQQEYKTLTFSMVGYDEWNLSLRDSGLVNGYPKIVLVTFGEKEDREDGGTGTEGIDNFHSLIALLSDVRQPSIRISSEVFPTFGHMETALPSFTRGVLKIQ